MPSPDQVQIALVGTGHIGPRHAISILSNPDAALACFVDPAPSPEAISLADVHAIPIYSSIDRMLAVHRPNTLHGLHAAVLCTPNSTHVPLGTTLLEAGLTVLVEKPLATTADSGRALVAAARKAWDVATAPEDDHSTGERSLPFTSSRRHEPANLLIAHHRRFHPLVTAARRALPHIGRPIAVSGLWAACKPHSYFESPADWRADRARGGGVVLINLIHDIDILQYLLGPIVRVSAESVDRQRGRDPESPRHNAEEGAAILLRFESGVVGTFIVCDAAPSNHNFESCTGENPMIPHSGSNNDIYRIFGSDGVISVGGDVSVTAYAPGTEKSWTSEAVSTEVLVEDGVVPFDVQIAHLVKVLRLQEAPRCSGEDGLRALVVCEAIKEAMRIGVPVDCAHV